MSQWISITGLWLPTINRQLGRILKQMQPAAGTAKALHEPHHCHHLIPKAQGLRRNLNPPRLQQPKACASFESGISTKVWTEGSAALGRTRGWTKKGLVWGAPMFYTMHTASGRALLQIQSNRQERRAPPNPPELEATSMLMDGKWIKLVRWY